MVFTKNKSALNSNMLFKQRQSMKIFPILYFTITIIFATSFIIPAHAQTFDNNVVIEVDGQTNCSPNCYSPDDFFLVLVGETITLKVIGSEQFQPETKQVDLSYCGVMNPGDTCSIPLYIMGTHTITNKLTPSFTNNGISLDITVYDTRNFGPLNDFFAGIGNDKNEIITVKDSSGTSYDIELNIFSSGAENFFFDIKSEAITDGFVISMIAESNGALTVTIPKSLFDTDNGDIITLLDATHTVNIFYETIDEIGILVFFPPELQYYRVLSFHGTLVKDFSMSSSAPPYV